MKIEGTLTNGFKYEYDDKVFHYMKTLKLIRDMKKPDTPEAFYDFCELLLGPDQLKALEDHIEKTTGEPATVEQFNDITEELTAAAGEPVKN